jgi:hypothetical protein
MVPGNRPASSRPGSNWRLPSQPGPDGSGQMRLIRASARARAHTASGGIGVGRPTEPSNVLMTSSMSNRRVHQPDLGVRLAGVFITPVCTSASWSASGRWWAAAASPTSASPSWPTASSRWASSRCASASSVWPTGSCTGSAHPLPGALPVLRAGRRVLRRRPGRAPGCSAGPRGCRS